MPEKIWYSLCSTCFG